MSKRGEGRGRRFPRGRTEMGGGRRELSTTTRVTSSRREEATEDEEVEEENEEEQQHQQPPNPPRSRLPSLPPPRGIISLELPPELRLPPTMERRLRTTIRSRTLTTRLGKLALRRSRSRSCRCRSELERTTRTKTKRRRRMSRGKTTRWKLMREPKE